MPLFHNVEKNLWLNSSLNVDFDVGDQGFGSTGTGQGPGGGGAAGPAAAVPITNGGGGPGTSAAAAAALDEEDPIRAPIPQTQVGQLLDLKPKWISGWNLCSRFFILTISSSLILAISIFLQNVLFSSGCTPLIRRFYGNQSAQRNFIPGFDLLRRPWLDPATRATRWPTGSTTGRESPGWGAYSMVSGRKNSLTR